MDKCHCRCAQAKWIPENLPRSTQPKFKHSNATHILCQRSTKYYRTWQEQKFSTKCDVRSGFWHVQLDKESVDLTTFATPFGRFRWNRMPFRIAPASESFQKELEQALEGLGGIRNIHDDNVILGEGETLH